MHKSAAPPITIGMPVYNGERYLSEALDTTLAQTFGDFELIICDNASTDRTREICRDYASRDSRITYVRNATNLGASRNYNLAFELASGKYFRWANHDDNIAPTLLERCVEVLEDQPSVVLAYGKTTLIDASGSPISIYRDEMHVPFSRPAERFRHVIENLGMCNVIYGLMRRDSMRCTALMGNHIGSDLAFVSELALHGKYWEIPETLFFRRIHPTAYSSQKDTGKLQQFYDPGATRKAVFSNWRRLWADFTAIERAPLTLRERIALRLFLFRLFAWRRTKLAQEIKTSMTNRLQTVRRPARKTT
jgi:glycosyltransferase involved in cell wall biosynthesis